MSTYPQASSLESILTKRCAYTGEDPEINQIQTQSQTKQDDWPEETQKNCPIKDSTYHEGATFSLESSRVSLFTGTLFLLINTLLVSLLSVSLWKFISIKPTGQDHGPSWSSCLDSALLLP